MRAWIVKTTMGVTTVTVRPPAVISRAGVRVLGGPAEVVAPDEVGMPTADAVPADAVPAEVGVLFDRHYTALCRLAALILGDRGRAEEVVMDAFLHTCASWDRIREPARADAYLRRAVVNGAHTLARRHGVERRALALAGARATREPAPPGVEQWVASAPVVAAVQALPARQRAAVVLRYYADLPEAEIAELLGCAVGTVKSQLAKARASLARRLGEEEQQQ